MAAAAAIVGARKGRERAQSILREKRARQVTELETLARKKQHISEQIMSMFDKSKSGGIDRAEVSPMLEQCSLEVYGKEVQPSADDIEFLFRLCCKSPNAEIKRGEVLQVIDAWKEMINSKEAVSRALQSHDDDGSGTINSSELLSLLNEVKDQDHIQVIPPEVLDWIFSKADVSGTGVLTGMEIARAYCAYDMWAGKRTQNHYAPDSMALGLIGAGKLPAATKLTDRQWQRYLETRASVLEALLSVDMDGDSAFSCEELSTLLVQLGWSEDAAARTFQEMDLNHDSSVSVDEFLTWIFGANPESDPALRAMVPARRSSGACVIT